MLIAWQSGNFYNSNTVFPLLFPDTNNLSGRYAKTQSCRINMGPVQLSAGDKIKIVSKHIGGALPGLTGVNTVRLRINKEIA